MQRLRNIDMNGVKIGNLRSIWRPLKIYLIAMAATLAFVSMAMAQGELPKNMRALKEFMFRQTNTPEAGLKIPP